MADNTTQVASPRAGQGILLALFLFLLTAASVWMFGQRTWWLAPLASRHGADIDRVFYVTLGITGVLFVLLQLGLGVLVFRFRHRGAATSGTHASRRLENRFALLAGALIFGVDITLFALGEIEWFKAWGPAPADSAIVEVTASQFMWHFRYAGKDGVFGRANPALISPDNAAGIDLNDPASKDDIVSANELHLEANRPVRVRLRSKDVIHSFFLPNLRVKQDVVPGMMIELWFVPTEEGQFEIVCNQLCGMFHHRMRGTVVVEKRERLESWLAELTQ
jgi:cytochrome c oxidase subunit 2